MTSKKKIAIYSGEIPSATFIERLIIGIGETHSVLLFGKKRGKVNYKSKKIKCFYSYSNLVYNLCLVMLRSLHLLFKYPKRYVKLLKIIKQEGKLISKYRKWSNYIPVVLNLPDVFHIQWAKDLKPWVFLKTEYGVKIIVSLRGAHINYSPIADKNLAEDYRKNFPEVDGFHAVSCAIAKEAQKYDAHASKIRVIHSPIPLSIFDKFKPLKKLKTETINIISVGRFHWKKGYEYAIDAIYQLKKQGLKVKYTIVASDKVSESILYQIHDLDLNDEISIKTSINQELLFDYMQTHDMLLLPSLEEGIANVVLEAMALGVPVISTNCGGMAKVVINNETGWLVPILDSKSITKAVLEINSLSEDNLTSIIDRAHAFVKDNFISAKSIKKFNDLYASICNNQSNSFN